MVFSGVVYFYYIVVSLNKCNLDHILIGDGISMLLWGTAVFMLSSLLAFQVRVKHASFRRVNRTFQQNNNALYRRAIILFLIGFVAYVSIEGFSFTILKEQVYQKFDANDSYGHTSAYIYQLIAICPAAICLMFASGKQRILLIAMIVLYIIIALLNGSRYFLAVLLLMFGTFYHLYPEIKKVNWLKILIIAVVFYVSMGIIEFTRNYGNGLDIDKIEDLEKGKIVEGATEGYGVFEFSAEVMEIYDKEDFIYFEPLVTAILMPFPRILFPNKPTGYYLREANIRVYGNIYRGAAFLNVTEAYISFGWLGVILYGLLFGLFSKLVWKNYLISRTLGSTLLLSSFNAWIYIFISRGYMAQAFTNFVFFVIIPFWMIWLINKLYKKKTLM
jgi:oligosaccharide repeat unit polymerase